MMYQILLIFVFLNVIPDNECLRILVVFPMSSPSHSILGHAVAKQLLEAGHEVVHMTSYPKDNPHVNLTQIDVGSVGEALKKIPDAEQMQLKNLVGQGNFGDSPLFLFYIAVYYPDKILALENVKDLLTNPQQKFDAVIVEWFFSAIFAGIAPLYQCPLIWFWSTEVHWQVLRLMDEVPNPSYTVDILSTHSPPLDFWERTTELWLLIKKFFVRALLTVGEKYVYNKYFSDFAVNKRVNFPSYTDAVYNGSLMLVNSHPSFGTPYRLPQSAKYIGGYHVDTVVKPLPKDLQKIMDEAKHGVIYFSMGSNLRSADMSEKMKMSFVKLFSQFKETVLWKFEEKLANLPDNIHLLKWAPQQSIFAHPNLKLFITHGGQLSTAEAIHYGVPVVGIPVFADQFVNMKTVERKGFGIAVSLSEDMMDELKVAVHEVLNNPKYKFKAKELSMVYHDRTMLPGKELVFWVEHVVRTDGAKHLRSPALDVSWYQKLYLDLALLVVGVIIVITKLVKFVINRIKKSRSKHKNE